MYQRESNRFPKIFVLQNSRLDYRSEWMSIFWFNLHLTYDDFITALFKYNQEIEHRNGCLETAIFKTIRDAV